jgi:2'-5' RNA ligase
MHRLFVALRPPRDVRAALLAVAGGVPGARWQEDEQLHVTTRFIGAVDARTAEDVAAALAGVAAPAPIVRIAGTGRFERKGRTDALWARPVPAEPLAALHAKVDRALARAGIAPEGRRYLPHVTLARFSRGAGDEAAVARWLAETAALATAPFPLTHLILFESHLGHAGARYEAIMRWPLDAA